MVCGHLPHLRLLSHPNDYLRPLRRRYRGTSRGRRSHRPTHRRRRPHQHSTNEETGRFTGTTSVLGVCSGTDAIAGSLRSNSVQDATEELVFVRERNRDRVKWSSWLVAEFLRKSRFIRFFVRRFLRQLQTNESIVVFSINRENILHLFHTLLDEMSDRQSLWMFSCEDIKDSRFLR